MSKKKKVFVGGSVALLALVIVVGALASSGDRGTAVRTEAVEHRDLVATVTANGKIEPQRKVDISADVSGRVVELAVEEGQWVERGALLLRLDPTSFQAAVRRQEAAVAQARAQAAQARANALQAEHSLTRLERMRGEEGLVSAADLEDAETRKEVAEAQYLAARHAIENAEAALSEAREQLRKTTIVAPMTGRVTRLNIEEGETAIVGTMNNPGSLLLTVADLDVMEARVKVDETDVPRISHGDSARIRIDAYPGEEFAGRVTRIANSAVVESGGGNSESVDFEIVVTLENPGAALRPDLSATAEIVTARRDNALAIPIIALALREVPAGEDGETQDTEGVFVVRNGHAEFVPVQVGITGDRHFEVLSGLEAGDVVVAGSYQAIRDLADGAQLRINAGPEGPQSGSGERAETEETQTVEEVEEEEEAS